VEFVFQFTHGLTKCHHLRIKVVLLLHDLINVEL
jgi:hypothetical protein